MLGLTVSLDCAACPSREARIEVPENIEAGQKVNVAVRCANPLCGQSIVFPEVLVEEIDEAA